MRTRRITLLTDDFFCTGTVSLALGNEHTCALLNDKRVYCWGNNDHGQLGNNETSYSLIPMAVDGLGVGEIRGSETVISSQEFRHQNDLLFRIEYCMIG